MMKSPTPKTNSDPLHPWKLRWHWKIPIFTSIFYIFKWWIFHCRVRFQRGKFSPPFDFCWFRVLDLRGYDVSIWKSFHSEEISVCSSVWHGNRMFGDLNLTKNKLQLWHIPSVAKHQQCRKTTKKLSIESSHPFKSSFSNEINNNLKASPFSTVSGNPQDDSWEPSVFWTA